jgi:hypothetical protein
MKVAIERFQVQACPIWLVFGSLHTTIASLTTTFPLNSGLTSRIRDELVTI